jgi:hypothetical protein
MTLRRAPISRALSEVFTGPGALPLLREAWGSAVGPDLAGRTQVLSFSAGTLVVRVPDGRWGRILHRMKRDILARLRETTGVLAPHELAFSFGSLTAEEAVATTPGAPPTPPRPRAQAPSAELLASAAQIDDAELREAFLRSAGRYLSRTRAG